MATFKRIDQLADSESGAPESGGSALVYSLSNVAKIFVFSYSPARKSLITWSDNAKVVLGTEDGAIIRDGNLFLRHVHEDDRFLLLTELENALLGKHSYNATYRWLRPDTNEVRWLHCRANLEADVFDGMIIDLTEEMTGSVSKLAGPDSLSNVLAAFPIVVFTLDRDFRILRINRQAESLPFDFGDIAFKRENFRNGRLLAECFLDQGLREQYQKGLESVLSGQAKHFRNRVNQDEVVYSVEALPIIEHGLNAGVLVTISDITEIVRLESQVSELQKNEGLRLLAAGVAHNFNNALQSIIGHAAAIEHHPDDATVIVRAAQAIQEIVHRSTELSRQLSSYEDAEDKALVPVDLNVATMAAVNRIEQLFSTGAVVDVTFGSPAPVLAKREPLIRAIEALLRNAKELTPSDGKISIKTHQSPLEQFEVGELPQGSYARLVVTDTGPGMSSEARARCLEPFFTTKQKDLRSGLSLQASGLGLSEANSIIHSFGGCIDIDSTPGAGTCISIYLPIDQSSVLHSASGSNLDLQMAGAPEILVVDDDLMVLETIRALLSDLGYKVVVADGFKRALSLAKTHHRTLRLALLDAVMPGMNGAAVLHRLKKFIPSLKVIGFSGAPPEYTKALLDAGAMEVLRKPVDLKTLKETVRRELENREAA